MKYKKALSSLALLSLTFISFAHNKLIEITPELKDLLFSIQEDTDTTACPKLKAICNHLAHGGSYMPSNILDKAIEELVSNANSI